MKYEDESSEEVLDGSESTVTESRDGAKENMESAQVDDNLSGRCAFSHEKLERVRYQLGLVTLSWPDHQLRSGENLSKLPSSYSTVSDIEKVLFWHAENFRKQFRALYPNRKPLLLTCANECGVQKFVSTAIRRTLLPYAELTTWQGCANFVSDFLTYEPLTKALHLPQHLYSPTYLLKNRCSNSFEVATFLVCLLLGLGYNAYVVSGYASREQTLCDQRKRSCPYLPKLEDPKPPPPKLDTSKYRPRSPPDFKSKFIEAIEAQRRQTIQDEITQREDQEKRMIMELERPAADPHFGKRIHAWVVLLPGSLGPRGPEVQEPVFIEPSTGVSYSTIALETANVYLGVESVWNNCNYWVNMQECTEACTKLEWNLSNIRHWEHLLPGEPESMRNVDDDEDEEVNTRREFHLVMPASYVDRLQIPYQVYEERYPNGKKTVYYKKSKVELFAPYLREDGLIELVTVFDDYEYQKALYIYKKYQNRSDKLTISEVDLSKDFTTDYYANGRADACHVHQYFSGNADAVDEERTLEFYDTKRLDDLISIRMHSLYASQDYKHRHDRLYNRYVDYSPIREAKDETIIHDRMITKIVEKFHRNEEIPACKDIAIREFDFLENEIRLTYHYEVGQYTQATRTFIKPPVTERGDRLVFLPEMTHGYNPNLLASPEDFDDLIDELIKQLNEEDISCAEIRHVEAEVSKFLQTREIEYAKPKLLISLFDPIRNDEAKAELFALEEKMKIQSEREMDEEIDFVSPYIARLGNLKYLTKNQALKVKEDCINDFKQAMVNRANSILREFDKYSNEMEKFQKIITQQSENLPREDKEEMLENINKITIKLRALEVRLNRHRKLVPNRYRKLLQSLQQNKQISILYDE